MKLGGLGQQFSCLSSLGASLPTARTWDPSLFVLFASRAPERTRLIKIWYLFCCFMSKQQHFRLRAHMPFSSSWVPVPYISFIEFVVWDVLATQTPEHLHKVSMLIIVTAWGGFRLHPPQLAPQPTLSITTYSKEKKTNLAHVAILQRDKT